MDSQSKLLIAKYLRDYFSYRDDEIKVLESERCAKELMAIVASEIASIQNPYNLPNGALHNAFETARQLVLLRLQG